MACCPLLHSFDYRIELGRIRTSSKRGIFKKGDAIVAHYRRLGAYYTGKVGAVNSDGTNNIFYDDGGRLGQSLARSSVDGG